MWKVPELSLDAWVSHASLATTGCFVLLLGVAVSLVAEEPQSVSAVHEIRVALEQAGEVPGGFSTFDCHLPPADAPPRQFDCDAVDREGNHFRYLLKPGGEGVTVDLVTVPADQAAELGGDLLEVRCRRLVDQYDREAWGEMHAGFSPELQEVLSLPELQDQLEPFRELLGKVSGVELESYGQRANGGHELQYSVASEGGTASFRCGQVLENDVPRIVAFLLAPTPGSPVYEELYETQAIDLLSASLGMTVSRFQIPFEKVRNQYDEAEGTAWLDSGQEFLVRVERTGRSDDFERAEFGFQVLDVPLFLTTHFRRQGQEPSSFDCPTRVVPDGETVDCTVDLDNGDRLAFTVARRGGEHRLLSLEKVPR